MESGFAGDQFRTVRPTEQFKRRLRPFEIAAANVFRGHRQHPAIRGGIMESHGPGFVNPQARLRSDVKASAHLLGKDMNS
jgi:hypothetical protein